MIVETKTMRVKSSAFANMTHIPDKYTCVGEDINPPLTITDIPEYTRSLALIIDDPDAPHGTFDHWVMWNIPVNEKIEENSAPGMQGKNGRDKNAYMGPCPPSGTHHYHFRIFALDAELDLPTETTKQDLLKAMEGHILSNAELIGLYEKTE
jgi:Raf kinase inhibitor-like YbhB/YbcL family protein